jgi:hypothetical protein
MYVALPRMEVLGEEIGLWFPNGFVGSEEI